MCCIEGEDDFITSSHSRAQKPYDPRADGVVDCKLNKIVCFVINNF